MGQENKEATMKHLALVLVLLIAAIAPAHADPEANRKVVLDGARSSAPSPTATM